MMGKKIFIYFLLLMLSPAFLLQAATYGPFKVKKVDRKFVYFYGGDSFKLSTGWYYKIFKVVVPGYPKSITGIQPIGDVKIFSVSDKSGILYFPEGATPTAFLRLNDRFFLVHGKFVELGKKEKFQKESEIVSIISGNFYTTYYNSNVNISGINASYKLFNFLSAVSVEFGVGYYTLEYLKDRTVVINEEPYQTVTTHTSETLSTFYMVLLGGFDTGKQAVMLGPLLGVVDNLNATGFEFYLRLGDIMGSNFLLKFVTMSKAELKYEFTLGAKILVSSKNGTRIGFNYKISTQPDINNANHNLLFSVSRVTSHSFIGLMAGIGIAGEKNRGPSLGIRGGIKF